jgi:hypothetical protein
MTDQTTIQQRYEYSSKLKICTILGGFLLLVLLGIFFMTLGVKKHQYA